MLVFGYTIMRQGDYFKTHTDGAWPGSKVLDGQLVSDAYRDRFSMFTFLILLNDGFSGGETEFYVNKTDPSKPARKLADAEVVGIRTPAGGVLCFPHGSIRITVYMLLRQLPKAINTLFVPMCYSRYRNRWPYLSAFTSVI